MDEFGVVTGQTVCELMAAWERTETSVVLWYLSATHIDTTTGLTGNGKVIGLWQDAVFREQKPVCPRGVVSYTRAYTHKNGIMTYVFTHILSLDYAFPFPIHTVQILALTDCHGCFSIYHIETTK